MSETLHQIVNNDKSFDTLRKYVEEAIGIQKTQDKCKDDLKSLEKKLKSELGLPKAEFKKVVKFVLDKDNKLPQEIKTLSSINSLVSMLK